MTATDARTDPTALPLAGRAALVTGGGTGIGLACAGRLLRDGATVTIMGRTEEKLLAGRAELEPLAPAGVAVQHVVGDVASEADVEAAVATAAEPLGGLHLAVINAGTGTLGPLLSLPLSEWERVIETNLTGSFLTLKHAGGAMVRSGGGAMVATSSIAGTATHRYMSAYSASKAGLDMLVQTAADELGPLGVRVNSVRPSVVSTEMGSYLENDAEVLADYFAQMPVARVGTPEDVAEAVRFLIGPESSWITGVCLSVDGGHALRRGPDFTHWVQGQFGVPEGPA